MVPPVDYSASLAHEGLKYRATYLYRALEDVRKNEDERNPLCGNQEVPFRAETGGETGQHGVDIRNNCAWLRHSLQRRLGLYLG